MSQQLIPMEFSVIAVTPSGWRVEELSSANSNVTALLTIGVSRADRAHLFRDLITGTSLWIYSNSTFQLSDPDGYSSGTIWAQQMVFTQNDVSVWHQDWRFSFTCNANFKTGFCFGWLIDRRYNKSYRILDPGRVD